MIKYNYKKEIPRWIKMLKIFRNADTTKRYTEISLKSNEKFGEITKLEDFENIVSGEYYGGAQEWYRLDREERKWNGKKAEKASNSGCGFVSIANCFAYQNYHNKGESSSKEDFLKLMTDIFDFKGKVFLKFGLFESGLRKTVRNFSKHTGYSVKFEKASFFSDKPEFIKENLKNKRPVILLFGWGKGLPFTEHWVTVTEIYEIRDIENNEILDHIITVSSWGKKYYFRFSETEKWIFNAYISLVFQKNGK